MGTRLPLAITCAALLGLGAYLTHRSLNHTPGSNTGEPPAFTAEGALARTAGLHDLIMPGPSRLQVADHNVLSGEEDPCYVVTAYGADGDETLNATWSARSGELLVVSRNLPAGERALTRPIARDLAATAARHWLDTLGLSGGEAWQIDSVSRRAPAHWLVRWHTPRRHGFLTLHRANGDLLLAVATRSRSDGQLAAAARRPRSDSG